MLVCGVNPVQLQDEQSLIENVASGDARAFDQLVCRYGKKVYAFVRKHCRSHDLAEDIVQDIFTRLWIIRECLAGIKNVDGFLYILSRNLVYDALRKELKVQRNQLQYFTASLSREAHSHQEPDLYHEPDPVSMQIDLINLAVQELPSQQKKVWELARRDGLKQSEIANRMNLSRETVKKYLGYATASVAKFVTSRMPLPLLMLTALFKH